MSSCLYRGVVQLARTPDLGSGGREFESHHFDQKTHNSKHIGCFHIENTWYNIFIPFKVLTGIGDVNSYV